MAKQPEAEPETVPAGPETKQTETSEVAAAAAPETKQTETSKVPAEPETKQTEASKVAAEPETKQTETSTVAAERETKQTETSTEPTSSLKAAVATDPINPASPPKVSVSATATAAEGHARAFAEVTQVIDTIGFSGTARAEVTSQKALEEKPDDFERLLEVEMEKEEILSRAEEAESLVQHLQELVAKLTASKGSDLPSSQQVEAMLRRPPTSHIDATFKRSCTDLVFPAEGAETAPPETKPPQETKTTPPQDTETKPPQDTETKPPQDTETKPPRDTKTKPPQDTETKPQDTETKPPQDTETKPPQDTETKPPQDTETKPKIQKAANPAAEHQQKATSTAAAGNLGEPTRKLQEVKTEPSDEPNNPDVASGNRRKEISEEERLAKEAHASYMRYYRSIRELARVSIPFRARDYHVDPKHP